MCGKLSAEQKIRLAEKVLVQSNELDPVKVLAVLFPKGIDCCCYCDDEEFDEDEEQ